jgi:hypothetical protein
VTCKINGEECDNKKKYELTTGFSVFDLLEFYAMKHRYISFLDNVKMLRRQRRGFMVE